MSADQRAEWRKDGKLPTQDKTSAAPADSATATSEPSQTASTEAPAQAASEPADMKAATAKRFSELLEKNRRSDERADRLERELAALRQPPTFAKPAAPQAATADDPEPDPAKYDDLTKYFKDQAAYASRQAVKAYAAEQQSRAQAVHVDAETQRKEQNWTERVTAATKHKDFDAAAIAKQIPANSLVDAWVGENEVATAGELLYYLQKNPAELQSILQMPVMQQARALVDLEKKVTKQPTVKLISTAPDPSPTLGVGVNNTMDEVTRAVKNKDPRAYREAANARDLANRRR